MGIMVLAPAAACKRVLCYYIPSQSVVVGGIIWQRPSLNRSPPPSSRMPPVPICPPYACSLCPSKFQVVLLRAVMDPEPSPY
ncbi:hypothetical protein B0H67DRAFT_186949 [Lasiosphaeris hirsuta]|uniref:Uncharacterized protein n=1 Tax=Lasiosphaeris hirsuta TaxID=260670 RepID=A0AA40E152_9PEZI|nr:hypothetical protein B0H67DRAFT_186949 [Lasiosphaeris hirsuta]